MRAALQLARQVGAARTPPPPPLPRRPPARPWGACWLAQANAALTDRRAALHAAALQALPRKQRAGTTPSQPEPTTTRSKAGGSQAGGSQAGGGGASGSGWMDFCNPRHRNGCMRL